MQSDGNSILGDIVFHKAYMDEDNILDQMYQDQIFLTFTMKI